MLFVCFGGKTGKRSPECCASTELLWGNTGEKNTYVFIHTFVAPALFPATVAAMYGYETGLSLLPPALNFF